VLLKNSCILICLLIATLALPVNAQYDFTASSTEGCTPMRVKFSFTSTALVDSVTGYNWNFGNGETSNLASPDSATYDTPGLYDVSLELEFTSGGTLQIAKAGMLTVHHTVPANFIYYDSVAYNTYVFEHSEPLDVGPVYDFLWNIEGFPDRTGPWQVVIFPDTGTYTVSLTVSDDLGCTSKVTQDVVVSHEIKVQNVFTPNHDGINDIFMVTTHGGFPLVLRIYSRTGILVYEIEGSTVTWDGLSASGIEMKPGIYFYAIKAREGDPTKRYTRSGALYLFR
jgi:gliding motility-associated-like protein